MRVWDFDWKETVVFFNDSSTFDYSEPTELIDLHSGVICMPENYGSEDQSGTIESKLRITHPANFDKWNQLNEQRVFGSQGDLGSPNSFQWIKIPPKRKCSRRRI